MRYNLYKPREGGGSFSNDFTTVALDWTPDSITMLMNDAVALTKQAAPKDPNGYYSDAIGAPPGAPFNIPFYLILNLAVGGRYCGNATDATVLPAEFTFDYIRVFGQN